MHAGQPGLPHPRQGQDRALSGSLCASSDYHLRPNRVSLQASIVEEQLRGNAVYHPDFYFARAEHNFVFAAKGLPRGECLTSLLSESLGSPAI
jgi:hypothetical protein